MPSNESTTQKGSIHGVIVALAVLNAVGLFALYVKVDQLSSPRRMQPMPYWQGRGMMKDDSLSRPPFQKEMTETKNPSSTGWKIFNGWDLSFKYPKDWYVTLVDDDFVEKQKDIRITSSPGELRLGGGPGAPEISYFDYGFQAELSEMARGQNLGKLTPTDYPLIFKVDEPCEEAGCPSAEYIFLGTALNSRPTPNYRLTFHWRGKEDINADTVYQPIVEEILHSLQAPYPHP